MRGGLTFTLRTGGFAASISMTRRLITRRSRSIAMVASVTATSCARSSRLWYVRAWMPAWSRVKASPLTLALLRSFNACSRYHGKVPGEIDWSVPERADPRRRRVPGRA